MQFIRPTGPWFLTYPVTPGCLGIKLHTSDRDAALSGGALGRAVVVGWRCRKRTFRHRDLVLGRER